MKKYMICGVFALTLICSLTASAQYGRNNGRYNNRYNSRHYSYPRYNYAPRTSVSIIARLPFGAASITFGNRYYHYHNGIYYRPYNRGYMMVAPPMGIIVPSLPIGYTQVIIGSHPYYRYGNIYYAPYGNRYRVVEEPRENEVYSDDNNETGSSSTDEYEKVVLEGKTYYKKGDKYYKASVKKDGEIVYEEVGEKGKSK